MPTNLAVTVFTDNSYNYLNNNETIHPVLDFNTTPLPEYKDYYSESHAQWSQAAVHYGLGPTQNYANLEYRNSERILLFDSNAASRIFNKLLPHNPEIVELASDILTVKK